MPRSAKVAISLPEQLLGDIEQYIAAYRAIPEVVDEGLYQAGLVAIAQEPWEDEGPK
jgi:hypothetical protein